MIKEFTIKKGSHYSFRCGFIPHFGITFKNTISFSVKFDDSCLYDLGDSDNYDVNKLYGLSTSYNHTIQSARIGWRCIDNKHIELMTFAHDENKFLEPKVLGSVLPNEWVDCKIIIKDYSYIFYFTKNKNTNIIVVNKRMKSCKFKYKLFYYFGGNKTAPHNMCVYIKDPIYEYSF